jgi:hypothetical protein
MYSMQIKMLNAVLDQHKELFREELGTIEPYKATKTGKLFSIQGVTLRSKWLTIPCPKRVSALPVQTEGVGCGRRLLDVGDLCNNPFLNPVQGFLITACWSFRNLPHEGCGT